MKGIEKPCPFCGSTKITFGTSCIGKPLRHLDSQTRWFVGCEECGAYGPAVDDLQVAKVLWDKRIVEEQEVGG